jgi:hypothetical protein
MAKSGTTTKYHLDDYLSLRNAKGEFPKKMQFDSPGSDDYWLGAMARSGMAELDRREAAAKAKLEACEAAKAKQDSEDKKADR